MNASFRRSAFAQLALMSARDLLRNRQTGVAPVFLFLWLLLLYWILSLMLTDSSSATDTTLLSSALPSILMTGLAGIAFMATTVPLVSMRGTGLLRVFGMTPLTRSTFLFAQLPARVLLVAGEVILIVAIAQFAEYPGGAINYWRIVATLIVGTSMLFACAILFAGRGRNAEANHQLMTALPMGLMVFSGTFLPPGTMPAFTTTLTNALPSTWFSAAIAADLTGREPFLPIVILWAMMLTVTAAVGIVAFHRFEWDREEPEIRVRPKSKKSTMKETAQR